MRSSGNFRQKATTASTDRKSTRLNSSHRCISYAVFCLKKKTRSVGAHDPDELALVDGDADSADRADAAAGLGDPFPSSERPRSARPSPADDRRRLVGAL